jgi:HPt (histidine-containing phosphotransfer) domain-containing protein
MEQVSTIAHKTKGTALNTGFNLLATIAADIEDSASNKIETGTLELLDRMKKEIEYLTSFFDGQNIN